MQKTDVLLTLLEKDKMTFQDIVDGCFTNRNKARKQLDVFIKKGLIKENRKNWRRGQKLYFCLTSKGKIKCVRKLEAGLRMIDFVLKTIEKYGFEEFRKSMRKLSPNIRVNEPYARKIPVAEDDTWIKEQIDEAFQKLNNAFLEFYFALNTYIGKSELKQA